MKYLKFRIASLCTCFIFAAYSGLFAQSPAAIGKITGTITDSVSSNAIEFATIALIDPITDKPVDGTIADGKGKFTINKVPEGRFTVTISFMGYISKTFQNIEISRSKSVVDLGNIALNPSFQVLGEITVEGKKELFEERVDRTIYNAENDETTKGGDAADVLRRVPMLSVDMDGNVSMRGNQNIRVLINNKPSSIMAASVSDALKQIPADEIKSVEIITSPSARYDAEGSAGIINIITKKNALEGLSLSINSGFGLRGSNLGLNGGYRKGKLGLTLGGFGRAGYNVTGAFDNDQLTTNADNQEILNSQSASTRNRYLFGNYTFGMDYDFNKRNYIIGSVRFGARNFNTFQDNLLTQTFQEEMLLNSSLRNVQISDLSSTVDVNFNYTHLFAKPQEEFSFLALYSRNLRNNDFENIVLNQATSGILTRFQNRNDSYNEEIAFQADYQKPINKNQMLEFGAKETIRKVVSEFDFFTADGATGPLVPSTDSRLSNNFNYDQSVTAAYLSYTYNTSKAYSFKAGARYEYTFIQANFQGEADIDIPDYGVLVPSINVSRKLKNGNMIKAAYNRRIQRPSLQFLNPNIQAGNPLNITIGNPELEPEFTNNFELGYNTSIKGSMISFTGFARNTNNAIQSLRDIIGSDTIRTTYENIGLESAYGMSIYSNINISNKFTLSGGTDLYYAVLNNNDPSPIYAAANEGWVASYRAFGNYKFNDLWAAQFFGFYRGRQVQLQGFQGGFGIYSLGFRRDFKNKKGSIGFGAENFFTRAFKIRSELNSPVISQQGLNTLNNMSVRVNFSYRIGKMGADTNPRRKRRTITSDDLKDGMDGGGMGGGIQEGGGGASPQGGRPQQGARPQSKPPAKDGDQKPGQGQEGKPAAPEQKPENKE